MYIGEIIGVKTEYTIFGKKITLKKGSRFLAKNGILRDDIKAKNVKVLKDIDKKDSEYTDWVTLENDSNKSYIASQLSENPREELEVIKAKEIADKAVEKIEKKTQGK